MLPNLPLNCLRCGQSARIAEVFGCPDQVHRLSELGLRSGAQVEMIQAGSPCIIRLAGSKLCFREEDVFSVLVAPDV